MGNSRIAPRAEIAEGNETALHTEKICLFLPMELEYPFIRDRDGSTRSRSRYRPGPDALETNLLHLKPPASRHNHPTAKLILHGGGTGFT